MPGELDTLHGVESQRIRLAMAVWSDQQQALPVGSGRPQIGAAPALQAD